MNPAAVGWYVKHVTNHETRYLTPGGNWSPAIALAKCYATRQEAEARCSRVRRPIIAEVHRVASPAPMPACLCREYVGKALKLEEYCPVHGDSSRARVIM